MLSGHFPVTADIQHSACVSGFTWADIISFSRNSVYACMNICSFQQGIQSIKSISYPVGRQLSLSGWGCFFFFFGIPQRAWTHHWQSKAKSFDIWRCRTLGVKCVGTHAYTSTNTRGQSGYFSLGWQDTWEMEAKNCRRISGRKTDYHRIMARKDFLLSFKWMTLMSLLFLVLQKLIVTSVVWFPKNCSRFICYWFESVCPISFTALAENEFLFWERKMDIVTETCPN